MTILYCLLLLFAYRWITWHIPPLIPFSTINSMSISVNNSNFSSVFLKPVCYANPGAERNFTGPDEKFVNTFF